MVCFFAGTAKPAWSKLWTKKTLKETDFQVEFNVTYSLTLKVQGQNLQGWVDGKLLFDLADNDQPLEGGAAALLIEEGTLACDTIEIE